MASHTPQCISGNSSSALVFEVYLNLKKNAEEEELGSLVAYSMKFPQANPMGCKTVK